MTTSKCRLKPSALGGQTHYSEDDSDVQEEFDAPNENENERVTRNNSDIEHESQSVINSTVSVVISVECQVQLVCNSGRKLRYKW